MGRTRKTYRLSDEAIQLIENRDRTAYPTATDFIEAKLNKPTKDVTELLYQVSMQLEENKEAGGTTKAGNSRGAESYFSRKKCT